MEEYTKEYYQSINKTEIAQAKAIAKRITELYNPKSVIDIGCGTGLYLSPFTCDKCGVDISPNAFDQEVLMVDRGLVSIDDLRVPRNVYLTYDVTICFEVLEHIGSEYADILVDNISQYSNTIILTASPPGQAGLNHVNCQPQKYWDEKFEARGFHRDYHDEFQLVWAVHQVEHTIWLVRNLMVYKK